MPVVYYIPLDLSLIALYGLGLSPSLDVAFQADSASVTGEP